MEKNVIELVLDLAYEEMEYSNLTLDKSLKKVLRKREDIKDYLLSSLGFRYYELILLFG